MRVCVDDFFFEFLSNPRFWFDRKAQKKIPFLAKFSLKTIHDEQTTSIHQIPSQLTSIVKFLCVRCEECKSLVDDIRRNAQFTYLQQPQ